MRGGVSVLLWSLVVAAIGVAAEEVGNPQPHLVFDAGGHTAAVNKVRFVADGQQIVTVSNDKTVRIWSVRTGEPLEVLRPPVGPGAAGMLYATDISSDGRWLAVGGYEFAGNDHGIYLIRMPERTIAAVFRGHTNVIVDLVFSPDSQLLASASADKTARLWDIQTFRNRATLRGHRDGVYGVTFSPDGAQLATASLDKTGRIWSVPDGAAGAVLRGHVAALQAIDWGPDGSQLATGCVDQSINLWSPSGQVLRRIEKLGNHVTSVNFTKNSRDLFFTLGGGGARDGGFIIDLAKSGARAAFTAHENSVLDGALSRDGSLAATADANGEICVWRSDRGTLVHRLRSQGQRPWSAAWNPENAAIAWGNTSDYVAVNQRGPLEYAFQLRDLEFVQPGTARLRRARTRDGSALIDSADLSTLTVIRPGSKTALKLPSPRDRVRCFTLLDERTAAVGSDFGLFLFNADSTRPFRQLSGHSGVVWAVAPSPDGRLLLSAGDDQSLRLWNWRKGRLLLSLFFAGRQWIAWTPEGYYAASPGGERLMGWHINNGRDRLGSFYPASHFRKSLYRPELIRRLLDAGSVERVLADLEQERRPRSEITSVEQVLPPVVQIIEPVTSPLEITQPEVKVRAKARSRGQHLVTALRLLLNGRPYEGRKGVYVVPVGSEPAEEVSGEWTVELTPGRHSLAVQAETPVSKGISNPIEIFRPEPDAARLPDLYILAIGVAAYPDALRLEYAAKDAQVLTGTLQEVSKSLYRDVKVQLLTNDLATRRNILSGLSWLRREMTQRDVTVFFFSGHGAKDDTGNFYLVPIDGEPADLLATGVSGSQFKDALAAIPGRVLVLLDACHAGAAGGDRRKAVRVLTDDLVRDLVTDDYGVIVMCSSMGREYSMESEEHKQGYFTVALLEALTGKADYNDDGLVYLTEIDAYLSDRVKVLTLGQQHPVTTKPATIRSFPLSRLDTR